MSIVIPARNEAATILRTLEALANLTHRAAEIVVVDGGSTDETVAIARQFAARHASVRVVEAGPATPGRGRNVGMAATATPWIGLTDAGAYVDPGWLEEMLAAVQREPRAGVVYGTYEPIADSFLTKAAALAFVAPRRPSPHGPIRAPTSASMMIRRDVWKRAGGFPDLRAAEDLLFFDRLERDRVEIAWAPGAIVRWELPRSLWAIFRRFSEYSRHNVRAGLQARWHHGVARQYAIALAIAMLAIWIDPRWWVAIPALAIVRAAASIWRRHRGIGAWHDAINPVRLAAVLTIILIIDAATFAGWIAATVQRRTT